MPSLIQDLGIGEAILSDLAAFAAGAPITAPEPLTIAGKLLTVSVVHIGTTEPASGYTIFAGGVLAMLETGIMIGAEFEAGEPVAIAEKIGNIWYGETFTPVVAAEPKKVASA